MSETTMDAAAKGRVKDALVASARAQLQASEGQVSSEEAAATVDQDSSYAVDDLSKSDEAGDMSALFEGAAARQKANVDAIQALDVAPRDTVGPGAIVGFGGARYLVGVVADSFEVDGVSYEGISTDSPIYPAIEGLRAGDSFTFRDASQSIDFLA